MRTTIIVLAVALLAATGHGQALAGDLFLTFDYPQGYGDCDLDNLVLADENGVAFTITFDNAAPLPGGTVEPYSGALYWEGPYLYEALTVDFALGTISGYFHHHPIPFGGVGGSGYVYSHPAMAIRVFRLDGLDFKMVSLDYRGAELPLRIGTQHSPASWQSQSNVLDVNSWQTLEMPVLGDAAAGAVGAGFGGPYDVVLVDGSAGGNARVVDVAVNTPVSFDVLQPPTRTLPADFLLFGYVGIPAPGAAVPLGIHGDLCFLPGDDSTPTSIGQRFLLSSSLPALPGAIQLLGGNPTPWAATVPGSPQPVEFTLQGVIAETQSTVKTTNALVVRIQ